MVVLHSMVGSTVQEPPYFYNAQHFLKGQKASPDLQILPLVSGWEGVDN